MGYSCTMAAADVFDAWQEGCKATTNTSNVYEFAGGKYFFERGRENPDGSITGTIYKYVSETHAKKSGTFKIDADGKILRAHSILKTFAQKYAKPSPRRMLLFV